MDTINFEDMFELFQLIELTLEELKQERALVGGLAVSVQTDPRFTNDIDISISVSSDEETQ
jgi:hypothetical protein